MANELDYIGFKKEMLKHLSFYKNILWQYVLQIVKYLFPLVLIPYLTRVLEPDGYAVYAYVLAFMGFVQVAVEFGFNLLGTKLVASAKSDGELGRILGSITQARTLLCAVAGICTMAACAFVPIMGENPVYCALSYAAVCGRALAPDFLFQGKERMSPITTRYLVSKGASTLLTFVVVRSFDDILLIPVLDILASAIALAWSLAAARRMFGAKLAWVPIGNVIRDLREATLYFVSNMSSAVFTGFTTLLIGVIVADQAQIAYWSLAMTAISAVQSLYSPVVNSLYPHMVANGDFRFARKIAIIAVPPVLVGTVAFAWLAAPIMLVLGGREYLAGAWILSWVSPVLFFSFFAMVFGWPVLGAANRVSEVTKTTASAAAFSIASLLLIALFGQATLQSICLVRCLTEMLLCAFRVGYCIKFGLLSKEGR